jgi:hypothetical protein
MLALALTLTLALSPSAAEPVEPLHVLVVVPLCDGEMLACGTAKGLGDPRSLENNLYWGAMYGVERFLPKRPGFRVVTRTDAPDAKRPGLLRETVVAYAKTGRPVTLRMQAWDGKRIDDALTAFLDAARLKPKADGGRYDLVVWAGHDRLMDVPAPAKASTSQSSGANVAVLACISDQYFGPVLDDIGAKQLAMTRSLMAPEAYLLEAMTITVAEHGFDRRRVRDALVAAYAKYGRISTKAAGTVFTKLE